MAILPRLFLPTTPSKTILKDAEHDECVRLIKSVAKNLVGSGRSHGSLSQVPVVASVTAQTPDFPVTIATSDVDIEVANAAAIHVGPEPEG